MKITERRLRSIIRSVIKENFAESHRDDDLNYGEKKAKLCKVINKLFADLGEEGMIEMLFGLGPRERFGIDYSDDTRMQEDLRDIAGDAVRKIAGNFEFKFMLALRPDGTHSSAQAQEFSNENIILDKYANVFDDCIFNPIINCLENMGDAYDCIRSIQKACSSFNPDQAPDHKINTRR